MNKYLHASICCTISAIKCMSLCIFQKNRFSCESIINLISPRTEITVDSCGKLNIGKLLRLRSGAKIRVRKNAIVSIGRNVSISNNCMVVAWEKIIVGDNVQFGPGVLVYDQDHDYKATGGLKSEKYITSDIEIGEGTWIGANSIILRGSHIGKNCVVAAGTVVKGDYPDNTLIYTKRTIGTKFINN